MHEKTENKAMKDKQTEVARIERLLDGPQGQMWRSKLHSLCEDIAKEGIDPILMLEGFCVGVRFNRDQLKALSHNQLPQ